MFPPDHEVTYSFTSQWTGSCSMDKHLTNFSLVLSVERKGGYNKNGICLENLFKVGETTSHQQSIFITPNSTAITTTLHKPDHGRQKVQFVLQIRGRSLQHAPQMQPLYRRAILLQGMPDRRLELAQRDLPPAKLCLEDPSTSGCH
jgi:hypothetical protein